MDEKLIEMVFILDRFTVVMIKFFGQKSQKAVNHSPLRSSVTEIVKLSPSKFIV